MGTWECHQKAQAYLILPPVISGKITTRNSFSFLYGTVEIKAKLPRGDWIYPELYLIPRHHEYGLEYDSGQMRVAYLPGNADLGKKLYGGVILGSTAAARSHYMSFIEGQTNWNNDFHVYQLKWTAGNVLCVYKMCSN